MIKVLILFGTPLSEDAFYPYFRATHLPLLEAVPHVERLTVNRVAGAAIGESPFALIVELEFPSEEAMQQGCGFRRSEPPSPSEGSHLIRGKRPT